ncbi:AP2 domain transcription factor ap2viia-1 [Cyclospora cayetanensis]|uniref:AP2 domain transcription factor ap2viia-1 n=1 Tax=Cyclospora cayetanensis TaxID=88456 RepID=A0A1D3CVG3_9EIME|nr:AP2 domain transcription factor ap2viia-1 [Cyclospora cayetanensis]
MAISPPPAASDAHAGRAWTDAEYFRLLSHELPSAESGNVPTALFGRSLVTALEEQHSPHSFASGESLGAPEAVTPSRAAVPSGSSSSSRTSSSSLRSIAKGTRRSQKLESRGSTASSQGDRRAGKTQRSAGEGRGNPWATVLDRRGELCLPSLDLQAYKQRLELQLALQRSREAREAEALSLAMDATRPSAPHSEAEPGSAMSKDDDPFAETSSPCAATPPLPARTTDSSPAREGAWQAAAVCPLPEAAASGESLSLGSLFQRQKRVHECGAAGKERLSTLPKVTGVRFQAQRNRFVAEWYDQGKTRMAYFPVKQHGFEEARRLAIECRKRVLQSKHQRLSCSRAGGAAKKGGSDAASVERSPTEYSASASPSLSPSLASPEHGPVAWKRQCISRLSETRERQREDSLLSTGLSQAPAAASSSAQENLLVAQAALNALLLDLLRKCLPGLREDSKSKLCTEGVLEALRMQLQGSSAQQPSSPPPTASAVPDCRDESSGSGLASAALPHAHLKLLLDALAVSALRQ